MNLFKKRAFLLAFFAYFFSSLIFAQGVKKSAVQIKNEALQKDSVQESIEYISSQLSLAETPKDRRSLLYFLGQLQEQLGMYVSASQSYVEAAGIAATDAEGMPKATSERLVLFAVRCCLQSGDYETADSYLQSEVSASKDETVRAFVKLYSAWSALCKAKSLQEISDTLALLKAYSEMQSMKAVQAPVLLTLWYLTANEEYGAALQRDFPLSPECAIVKGNAHIMSVPFWYFVPRVLHEEVTPASQSQASVAPVTRLQLGLFRKEENAHALIERVREKGFAAYSFSEQRASGTVYYIVVVDDTDGSTAKRLREAGFECYELP